MKSPRYAVVSVSTDGHIPFVEKYLDAPLVVIDPAKVLEGVPMSYRLANGVFETFYDSMPLNNIVAVWYRKPDLALPAATGQQDRNDYIRHAMHLFMRQFYGLLPQARWVSNYYAMVKASDKLWQLTVAHQLGFHIPDTLVTSSAREAEAFVQSRGEVIVKPIGVKEFSFGGERRIVLAHTVNQQTANFAGLHLAPAIIQQAIDVDVDIRVAVVGKKVFAAAIVPQVGIKTVTPVRDWRIGNYEGKTTIKAFVLPKHIADMCIAHVREMGLQYGGIDLILDKKGVFWFLENNPNGQWAFIEEVTGQPIGEAFAQLLMTGQ